MNTRIISFANHKGGVGKTTTTVNVGSILSSYGYKVLLIDLDAQAHLTVSLLNEEPDTNIYHVLTGKQSEMPIIEIDENLSIVPSSLQLAMAEIEMSAIISRERILSDILDDIKENYDYILLDCPPSLGLVTLNAITASNEIIVPLVSEVLPFKGLEMITRFIDQVRQRLNKEAHITGILITRWEKTTLTQNIEIGLRQQLGSLIFNTKIRKNITLAAAPLEKRNIVDYSPKCNGAQDYISFVKELLLRLDDADKIHK